MPSIHAGSTPRAPLSTFKGKQTNKPGLNLFPLQTSHTQGLRDGE